MTDSVSSVHGTLGHNRVGRLDGSFPWSPTFGTSIVNTTAAAVSNTIATNGAGIAAVSRGKNTMISTPTATIGYTRAGTPNRCGSWAMKIKIASALTNPTMTLRGMN